jgi:hypothetical protein
MITKGAKGSQSRAKQLRHLVLMQLNQGPHGRNEVITVRVADGFALLATLEVRKSLSHAAS